MAETSRIEWTDATVNFWWGCTKVGPGCDHCYAEAFDRRTGGAHWGLGAPRRKIKGAVKLLHKLDNGYADWAADRECRVGNAKAFGLPVPQIGIRRKVFIQSMSDLFDLEVPVEWFAEAWETIEGCDRLDLQIVTKRVSAVEKRLAAIGAKRWPRHAGLMITVVNQDEADRDVPRLLALKAKLGIPWVGLSMEPLLGPVDLSQWLRPRSRPNADGYGGDHAPGWTTDFNRLDWVIVGGESGPGARPFNTDWALSIVEQCRAASVPCFVKQLGAHVIQGGERRIKRDKKGGDMSEWPHALRLREMPVSPTVDRETGEPVNRRG